MNTGKNWQRCNAQTFWQEQASCSHVVQIYENEEEFLNILEGFVTSGFASGDAVILIATAEHLSALNLRLRQSGIEVDVLRANGLYQPLNAEEVLAKFMVNGWPDYSLFMQSITEIFSKARQENRNIRAFGEMVAILWAQGKSAATIMLEQLWNMHCEKEPFTLLCAYPKSAFPEDSDNSIKNICKHHSKLISGKNTSKAELAYLNVN